MRKPHWLKRFKVHRDVDRVFHAEWVPDILGGLMVTSVTLFGIRFVYLGTESP